MKIATLTLSFFKKNSTKFFQACEKQIDLYFCPRFNIPDKLTVSHFESQNILIVSF